MTTVFISPGMIVHVRSFPMPRGVAIVVGASARSGKVRVCRWRGGPRYWGWPRAIGQEHLEAVSDWTQIPLTEAKRLAAAAFERNYLARAMASAGNSVTDAARLAGVDRSNFRRLLQRHGLAEVPQRSRRRKKAKRSR